MRMNICNHYPPLLIIPPPSGTTGIIFHLIAFIMLKDDSIPAFRLSFTWLHIRIRSPGPWLLNVDRLNEQESNSLEREDNRTKTTYRIRVKGIPGKKWSSWFEEFDLITQANGETLMVGPITDQAALHGLLARLRNLGLPLISVENITATEH